MGHSGHLHVPYSTPPTFPLPSSPTPPPPLSLDLLIFPFCLSLPSTSSFHPTGNYDLEYLGTKGHESTWYNVLSGEAATWTTPLYILSLEHISRWCSSFLTWSSMFFVLRRFKTPASALGRDYKIWSQACSFDGGTLPPPSVYLSRHCRLCARPSSSIFVYTASHQKLDSRKTWERG